MDYLLLTIIGFCPLPDCVSFFSADLLRWQADLFAESLILPATPAALHLGYEPLEVSCRPQGGCLP